MICSFLEIRERSKLSRISLTTRFLKVHIEEKVSKIKKKKKKIVWQKWVLNITNYLSFL